MIDVAGRNNRTMILPVDDGSPWSVHVDSFVNVREPLIPRVIVIICMSGKRVDVGTSPGSGLLEPEWKAALKDLASKCVSGLRDRQVPVPYKFLFELESALMLARKQAILFVVRHQAAVLIQHLSSEEACHEWALAEASHVMGS